MKWVVILVTRNRPIRTRGSTNEAASLACKNRKAAEDLIEKVTADVGLLVVIRDEQLPFFSTRGLWHPQNFLVLLP